MMPEYFKYHHHMCPIDTVNFKIVQQLNTLLAKWIGRVRLPYTGQQFDLINSRLGIVWGGFDDLKKKHDQL